MLFTVRCFSPQLLNAHVSDNRLGLILEHFLPAPRSCVSYKPSASTTPGGRNATVSRGFYPEGTRNAMVRQPVQITRDKGVSVTMWCISTSNVLDSGHIREAVTQHSPAWK